MTRDHLVGLASGDGGPESIRLLRAGQLSRQLMLLRHLADAPGLETAGRDALAVLDAARDRDRDAAGSVITEPMVCAWTAYAVRKVRGGTPAEAGLGQLAALAAVAAARAGVDAELAVPHHGDTLMIPAVGLVRIAEPAGRLRLRVRSGRLTVTGARTVHRWDLRRLTAGGEPNPSATVDDLSPYRDVYQMAARHRLSDRDAARWQELFAGAWAILSRRGGRQAVETARLVRTIVPLDEAEGHVLRSATAQHVFGAVGTTIPPSAATTAVTLVHEGSHSALNGILHLETLFDARDPALYFAPWRADPRPMWGLFHGVFAFLAVADMMNRLRAEPGEESEAEKQFAKVRGQLRLALDHLLGAPSLTESGRLFAACMDDRLTRLERVDVSPAAAAFATTALNADLARWRKAGGRVE